MADWQISRPTGHCDGSGKELLPGEEYYGALIETDEGLQRKDFSAEYWRANNPQVYCHWKSVMVSQDEKKKLFIDDDMLMAFFERLASETDQNKIDLRFVLMLVLMRKRLLKYLGSRVDNGVEIWKLKNMQSKDEVEVVNPALAEDKIEQLSEQIGQIMQGELE